MAVIYRISTPRSKGKQNHSKVPLNNPKTYDSELGTFDDCKFFQLTHLHFGFKATDSSYKKCDLHYKTCIWALNSSHIRLKIIHEIKNRH